MKRKAIDRIDRSRAIESAVLIIILFSINLLALIITYYFLIPALS